MNDSFHRSDQAAAASSARTPGAGVVAEASSRTDVADCAVRLESLVTKCVSFLQSRIRRLEDAYAEFDQRPAAPAGPEEQQAVLSEQQAAWDRKRAAEADRINEQLEHLSKAWSLLENEQRRQATEGTTASAPAFAQQGSPTPPASSQLDLVETPGDLSSSSAAIQFQKLKREIRQHARRNR